MQAVKSSKFNRNILIVGTALSLLFTYLLLTPTKAVVRSEKACVFGSCNVELSVTKQETGIPFPYYSTNPESDLGKIQASNDFNIFALLGDIALAFTPLMLAILAVEYRHEKRKPKHYKTHN